MRQREKPITKELNILTREEINHAITLIKNKQDIELAELLLSRVKILDDTGCWIIHRDWSNYAKFKKQRAHCLSYKLFVGQVVSGFYICHKCDRKGCINYKHLFQGTPSKNQKDWRDKKNTYLMWRRIEMNALEKETGQRHNPNKVIRSWRKP